MYKRTIPLVLAVAVAAASAYLLFRTVLQESEHPITFELFAALIGVSITIVLTSILLNRQTTAELRKEENILFLNQKMKVYNELIDQLYDIISKKNILEEDMIEIRLLNQKLAFIASQEVLVSFNKFSRSFATLAKQDAMSDDDIDLLLLELSQMSIFIRQDLLLNSPRDMDDPETIRKAILKKQSELGYRVNIMSNDE